MAVIANGRLGRALWRFWLVAALIYVLAVLGLSVGPVRQAFRSARQTAPTNTAPVYVSPTGPIPDAPASPRLHAYRLAGRQALIAIAPPLLLLWFGWDAWFAVTGFLRRS